MLAVDYESFENDSMLHSKYRNGAPFPHIVIDNFLKREALDQAIKDFPTRENPYWHSKSVFTSKKLDSRRKDKELILPESIRNLIWELHSYRLMIFLTRMTGIFGLIADPFLEGGGPHMIERGGFLKVHTDFNIHQGLNLERRLNLLLYLNRDWNSTWLGDLEFWSNDGAKCEKKISPIANRCVVFETTDSSWHGHPSPLNCPHNVTRNSIAIYYYSAIRRDIKFINTVYTNS